MEHVLSSPRIIGGVGIIGVLDIVIIINNKGLGIIGGGRGLDRVEKNSVGGFLVLICSTKHDAFFLFFNKRAHIPYII